LHDSFNDFSKIRTLALYINFVTCTLAEDYEWLRINIGKQHQI